MDLALWDRAGRRAGEPVCRLLTENPSATVEVNATIHASDRAGAASEAAAAARAGYSCVKLKVGFGDDAGRVAAVRAAAGPEMALRLDANGAWDVEQAVRTIEALEPAGLELVEEPVHGAGAIRAVRERVAVRIAADETAAEPGSLDCADAVVLKISRCGGIGGLLAAAALVRAQGAERLPVLDLRRPARPRRRAPLRRRSPRCRPAGWQRRRCSPGRRQFEVRDGEIAVPTGPGLGV